MDNPVDSPLDLGLVNYVQHPENKDYIVFRFGDIERADSFQVELESRSIWFERGEEMKRTRMIYLVGIHKNDFKRVERINYLVEAKHKKKLIPVAPLRYLILIISFAAMTLAIMGYCERQKTLQRVNDQYQSQ